MPYHIAGIDVHKKMLAVVVADVAVDGDYHFDHLKTGTSPANSVPWPTGSRSGTSRKS